MTGVHCWKRPGQGAEADVGHDLRIMQFSQSNFILAKVDDFRGDFAPASVEDHKFLPDPHAQNVACMVCFRPS